MRCSPVLRRSLIAGLLMLGAGCVPIPHRHVAFPAAVFVVRDQAHAPIPGARITLRSASVIGGRPFDSTTVLTNDAGVARTTRRYLWHKVYIVVPDGEAPWVWVTSVDAPGYRSAVDTLRSEPADTVRVTLEAHRSSAE
jgi:hypothetical protein